MTEELDEAIVVAHDALSALSDLVLEYTFDAADDVNEVGAYYVKIASLIELISLSKQTIDDALSRLMNVYEILSLPDEGVVIERYQGKSRVKWDNRTTRAVVAEKIVSQFLDEETGTLEVPPVQLIEEAFEYTGLKWKVTKLREVGMDPDDYSEQKDGKTGFTISKSIHSEEGGDDNEDFI